MTTRRGFLRKFIGGNESNSQEQNKTTNKIPLNRLNELPDHIVKRIIPVLFPKTEWNHTGTDILIFANKDEEEKKVRLDEIEYEIFQLFNQNKELGNIAAILADKRKLAPDSAFQQVSSLFFKLASMRVCHPLQVYNIDAVKGSENIPLNRLNELPNRIVEQIVPILFPQKEWSLEENIIHIQSAERSEEKKYALNETEAFIFSFFNKNTRLKIIAGLLAEKTGLTPDNAYQQVTSLFFKMAALRVCHPRDIYTFDKIRNKDLKQGT